MAGKALLDYVKKFGGANDSQMFHEIAKNLDKELIEIETLDLRSQSSRDDGYNGMKILIKNGPTFIFLRSDGYVQIGHLTPTGTTYYESPLDTQCVVKKLKELILISPYGDVEWPDLDSDSDNDLGFDLFG